MLCIRGTASVSAKKNFSTLFITMYARIRDLLDLFEKGWVAEELFFYRNTFGYDTSDGVHHGGGLFVVVFGKSFGHFFSSQALEDTAPGAHAVCKDL
jgi:hypothetical protein